MNRNLFPVTIFKTQIVPTEQEYADFDQLLSKSFSTTNDGVWALESGKSTGEHDLFLHHEPAAKWLIDATMEHVVQFWKTLDYRREANIRITSAWANLHKYGQSTGEHSHYGGAIRAHISAVYYFKKPKQSGNIEFVDPLEYIRKMEPIHQYDETGKAMYQEVDADQFDLVLFPSWLNHRTQMSLSTEDRVAVSINFLGLY